jgi:hypothetical protein
MDWSGTAEWSLNAISSQLAQMGSAGEITVVSPVLEDGSFEVIPGDSYLAADGRSIDFKDSGDTWPDLTGATIELTAYPLNGSYQHAMSAPVPSGAGKLVRLELTSEESLVMPRGVVGFAVKATLSDGDVSTLVESEYSCFP